MSKQGINLKVAPNTDGQEHLWVASPYDKAFVERARELGDTWSSGSKMWYFDLRLESDVRQVLIDIYGTDGGTERATVDVEITVGEEAIDAYIDGVRFAGRTLARAWGRDSGAKLGEGVVLVSGKIDSTGSVKNCYTTTHPESVLRVYNVPISKVSEVEIELCGSPVIVRILTADADRRQALGEERNWLQARLAEIEAELGQMTSEVA